MAGEVVGKATYETELDQAGLDAGLSKADTSIAKSGAAAEAAFGAKASSGVSKWGATALAAGTAGAVGFGLMAKSGAEAERAQGEFQAATGRSRTEAVAFTKDMNGLMGSAGTVGKSFNDVTDAGTAVAQQFNITGKANADLTSKFLNFSKVTGQNTADSVNAMEDALSAYNLTAADAPGLMDQLVASSQRFGTDAGPASVDALQKMAPALQGMNLGLDDGVGLLNLFETAGMDASKAPIALQTAVKNLKPGQNLDDLIAKIGAIVDPTDRAQAAMQIFGNKAGIGLANAIKPGMTSLDDFKLSNEEAAGAADKAATDMLTTSDKFEQFTQKIGGLFRDAGQTFGPFVSGVAGLGSLLAPALGKAWDVLKDNPILKSSIGAVASNATSLYKAGLDMAGGVQDALLNGWSSAKNVAKDAISAAGIVAKNAYSEALDVAQAIKFKLQDAWDLAKDAGKAGVRAAASAAQAAYREALALAGIIGDAIGAAWDGAKGLAGKAIGAAGAAAGALYAGALKVGQAIADGLGAAWDALGTVGGALKGTIGKAGIAAGAVYAEATEVTHKLVEVMHVAWDALKSVVVGAGEAGAEHGGAYAAGAAVVEKLKLVIGGLWTSIKGDPAILTEAGEAGAAGGEAMAAGAAGASAIGGAAAGTGLAGTIIGAASGALEAGAAIAIVGAALGALAYGAMLWATSSDPKLASTATEMYDFGVRASQALGQGFSDDVKANYAQTVADAIAVAEGGGMGVAEAQQAGLKAGQTYLASLGTAATDPSVTVGVGKSIFNQVSASTASEFQGPSWQDIWRQVGTGAGTTLGDYFNSSAGQAFRAGERETLAPVGTELADTVATAAEDQIKVRFGPFSVMVDKVMYAGWQNGPFIALGKSIPTDIASGAVDNGHALLDAGDRLIKLLQDGLSPSEEAAKLAGKKYTKAVASGIVSEIPGAKEAAQQMAVQSIAVIEKAANGTPSTQSLKAIGEYYDSLMASGMDAKSVAVALAAAGVSKDVIVKLTGYEPDFTKTGEAYSAHLATGITNNADNATAAATGVKNKLAAMPWGDWGEGVGTTYGNGIGRGINGTNFSGKIGHLLDQLRGMSPPRIGPIRDAVLSATAVGHAYGDNLIGGAVDAASARLHDLQAVLMSGFAPAQLSPLLVGAGSITMHHVVSLDLRNAPAGVTSGGVAAMLQPVVDFDQLWQAKMDAAMAATGVRWVD